MPNDPTRAETLEALLSMTEQSLAIRNAEVANLGATLRSLTDAIDAAVVVQLARTPGSNLIIPVRDWRAITDARGAQP